MKPKLYQIFPETAGMPFSDMTVEKIDLSKENRKMAVCLTKELLPREMQRIEALLREKYRLNGVEICCPAADTEYTGDESEQTPNSADAETSAKPVHKPSVFTRSRPIPGTVVYGRAIKESLTPIANISEESGTLAFRGQIFGIETKEIKSKKNDKEYHLIVMDITDYTDSISAQLFINKKEDDSAYERVAGYLKKGAFVNIKGKAQYNDYAHEAVINVSSIELTDSFLPKREDNAPVKRVELHMHTQMSAMDGISDSKELINRAVSWGHTAIAVTDHGVVQSFPDFMKHSDNNAKIKVLYGVEGYLVDDSPIVYDAKDEDTNVPFVVFDIETTGLSKYKNNITEIGAVKVQNGKITDKWSSFVNPGEHIPDKITELTSITDEMVKDAPAIDKILPEFLEFCSGCVLVAQNSRFDTGFIRMACARLGIKYDFVSFDTLVLARCLYPELSNYRLNTLSKHLGIVLEHHHRAVDDAGATAEIFIKLLEDEKCADIKKLAQFNTSFDLRSAAKKNKAYHIILLAKNRAGIKSIYEMVSESHLKYFYKTPRLPRTLIEEKRSELIIGSACEAGEFFRAVAEGADDEELKDIASFYDYLEIQPLGNNAYMKKSEDFPDINTDEDLIALNKKVIEIGRLTGKPTVATCDVHFLDPEGAAFRKILMHYKGFKDADDQAPLFLRTTEEMLDEFKYLGKELAYEVVVKNTNLIADMIEPARPIPPDKCPPEIEGAKEGIVNDSHKKAKEIYGDPLPDIVKERLDKELHSITTYGFAVMYRIAQELVRKSLSDGYLVGSRGSVGSSFVAFLSDITEVNSLPPHYICPNCKNSEFVTDVTGVSGCDLPDKVCPKCGTQYKKDGHDIPFETFLGFKGDKEPDIDLNFSGDYQPRIHKYTEELFGEGYVFRAGTIGTVAEKTAFGYVNKYAEEKGISIRYAEKKRLAAGCVGVKRTSGQHPGGIIVVPHNNDIHNFCPIQHPADDPNSDIITTHFDYHKIDQNLLKLDELGHDDPTVIRMLQDLTQIDPQTIPLDDKDTLSLFTSTKALGISEDIGSTVGTYGVPEFGTKFVRQMLVDTKPTKFSELIRISGLSHGTDVWLNNAQDLIRAGICTLGDSICTRDDIMLYLIHMGVEAGHAFKIMESVRKGKGLKPEDEEAMREANVPEWYLDSCKKIKYMFPKAHAVAYVTMAFRIAYCKVHYPEAFYIAYFSVRADDFDALIMARGMKRAREAMAELEEKKKNNTISPKETNLIPILEICIEMYARGIEFDKIDLYKSHATDFLRTERGIRPPLNALPGLGANAAKSITDARDAEPFRTVEDLRIRTGITKTAVEILEQNGCLEGLPERDQVSLFDM